jgi:glycosyltransferase involved in cell wall biosynthesis
MKIAFDLRRIKNPGIGRYMKCLVEAVMDEQPRGDYLLILPPGAEDLIRVNGDGAKAITSGLKYYSIEEQIGLPRLLRQNDVDLLHSPHFMLPLVRPCSSVVTIHDVIGLACKEDLGSSLGRLYYKCMMSAAVRLADCVITVSEFSKSEIVRWFGIDPNKIIVIYSGISSEFGRVNDRVQIEAIRVKYGIEGEYFVYTGIYKARKNHAGLLRAFRSFLAGGRDASLVLVGPLRDGEGVLRRLSHELGISDRVVYTGFVDDSELRLLYSGAVAYACPSLYEGFGFTVLEAMACGIPVVCSAETSLPEVAGNAALYADATNAEEFGQGLYQVLVDSSLRDRLVRSGRTNLERFSWAKTARETLNVYHDVFRSTSGTASLRSLAG